MLSYRVLLVVQQPHSEPLCALEPFDLLTVPVLIYQVPDDLLFDHQSELSFVLQVPRVEEFRGLSRVLPGSACHCYHYCLTYTLLGCRILVFLGKSPVLLVCNMLKNSVSNPHRLSLVGHQNHLRILHCSIRGRNRALISDSYSYLRIGHSAHESSHWKLCTI